MRYSDDELLKIVGEERKRSIGFGEGDNGELRDAREKALLYHRGQVKDVPALAGRSSAVSTDVAEAVETVLPDLLEIFVGGDDVATFRPVGQQDEEQAREESDYVKHVIFSENEGVLIFHTAIKDALLCRTGLFYWYWEEDEDDETVAEGVPAELAQIAQQMASMQGQELDGEEQEDGTTSFTRKRKKGKVCVKAIPPEDFSVGADTVNLPDATYCVMRARPRVQDLIARGVDPEVARGLKSYTQPDQQMAEARDRSGEETLNHGDATGDLRQVEVRCHYIRLLSDDNELTIWKVETDSEETVLISKEEADQIPFGAITPYINSHRFYGESVADKLMEIQRIKTTLWRMHLDSGYFALNQRNEVDMAKANEFTISDLLRNEPNMPVRVKVGGAITPLTGGGLTFDTITSLEYASTVGEARSGIVRNAQGLNPDTLHETAKGAIALMTAAQKRVRLMARQMSETGIKDLYLGVHALLRSGYGSPEAKDMAKPHVKLGKDWKDVSPGDWDERQVVDVQVGVGSAGREHDMMALMQIMEVQEKMLLAGLPTVNPENIYNSAKRFAQVSNLKGPDGFFTDPKDVPPQPPKPDPEMAKVEGQMAIEQAKLQAKTQTDAQSAQMDMQLQSAKHQAELEQNGQKAAQDHELAVMRLTAEMQLKREQLEAELQLKREQLVAELELKRELGYAQAQVARETGMAKAQASTGTSEVNPGGEPG